MSLSFQNSHLFWLLLLGLIPLLLHLFARTRPPKYEFSSVEFLRKVVRKTMRLRKPQDYILLLLRTLAVLALIGVFLRPLFFSNEKLRGLFEKKNVVVIVDRSASMAYVEGAQTRFAAACAEASDILSGLGSGDRANVIWLRAEAEAIFPDELGSNISYLRDQLRRGKVSSERGAGERALAMAVEMLDQEEDGRKEICVVSDFQRSGWKDVKWAVPEGIDLIQVKVGRGEAENLAVVKVDFSPGMPVVGETVTVTAELENFSNQEIDTTLFSEISESRRSENIQVKPGEKVSVLIRHQVGKAGSFPLRVSLAEDNFPGDDQRVAIVEVRPHLRVAVVEGSDTQTAKLWTRGIQSLGWAVPEWLSASEFLDADGSAFDAVFLAGWGAGDLPSVPKLVVLPSGQGTETSRSGSSEYELVVADRDAKLFQLFLGGSVGSLEGIRASSRVQLAPKDASEVLLAWEDGAPALIREKAGKYRWGIPLVSSSGTLASRGEFVTLLGELLYIDRGAVSTNALSFEAGDFVSWISPDEIGSVSTLQSFAPGGEILEVSKGLGGEFRVGPVVDPGAVEWRLDEKVLGYSAVNFPVVESDLSTMELAEVEKVGAAVVEGGREARRLREGVNLWPWLLSGAVCFLLMEACVILWAGRTT